MGSIPPVPDSAEEEITVLVTGFKPFRDYAINPSWSIASSLPPFLPPAPSTKEVPPITTTPTSIPSLSRLPPVRILLHPSPIPVVYSTIRTLVPDLWSSTQYGGKRIDYMIHIGMAGGRSFYSLERRGHRDGYVMRDSEGEVLGDEKGREEQRKKRVADGGPREGGDDEEEPWCWDGCPEELRTDVDVEDVWQRWRAGLPDTDVRISEDAGHYLCDFIYYSSLVQLWKADEDRRVVFLHVPQETTEEAIQAGVQVTLELIRGLVQSAHMKKIAGTGKSREESWGKRDGN